MKWKRSKKAQQEAKEKKSSSSSSSSSSTNVQPSTASQPSAPLPHNSLPNSMNGINTPDHISSTKSSADKMLDNNIMLNSHSNAFNLPKTVSSLDSHRHIVNLSSNLTEYNSNLDDGNLHQGSKLIRRPLIFADGNQNGDMFRPYVV